eukprot:10587568-Lingulodinium_polyedra.AAC.1
MAQWDYISDHLEEEVSDKTLRDLLFRQAEKSKVLAEDLAHYKRVGKRHDDHSYQFLRDALKGPWAISIRRRSLRKDVTH